MHFYNDVFVELCRVKGVKPTRAIINMGLSRSLVTKWAKTGDIPSDGSLIVMADYFGVSFAALKEGRIEYLDEKSPPPMKVMGKRVCL